MKPRHNPEFSPGADFSSEEYFVLSRCDGATTLRDIVLMVGFGVDRSLAILAKLRDRGAVLVGDESPADALHRATESAGPAAADRAAGNDAIRRPTRPRHDPVVPDLPPVPDLDADDLGELSSEEEAAMAEDVALDESEKRRVIAAMRRVRDGDYFRLLGVTEDADKRQIKRAYFRMSKEFHPDRHYGDAVGTFGPWFSTIFETVTHAFQVLGDKRQRAEYERSRGGSSSFGGDGPQSRAEHAADIYQRACDAELSGDAEAALRLFAAAIRVDGKPRYQRRAAMCALAAGELSSAEEYAKKAAELRPRDPSYVRVLADVYRAAGRLAEAEETLVGALELRTENDALVGELTADLQAVRAARAKTAGQCEG